jgi:hypothetical protein
MDAGPGTELGALGWLTGVWGDDGGDALLIGFLGAPGDVPGLVVPDRSPGGRTR